MANVQLLQPTDMGLVVAPFSFDNGGFTSPSVFAYGGLPGSPFFFSFAGQNLTPAAVFGGGLVSGTILTAAFDGADPDLIPNIFMTNVNFDVAASGFAFSFFDFQA